MSRTQSITTVEELATTASQLLDELKTRTRSGACVVALHGDLGVGKTTFTQLLARTLGVTEDVTSPTFVVMKRYETTDEIFPSLVHIDAYRIEAIDEMRVLGFAELIAEPDTIICIEWAERIVELLPADTLHLTFALAETGRELTITDHGT